MASLILSKTSLIMALYFPANRVGKFEFKGRHLANLSVGRLPAKARFSKNSLQIPLEQGIRLGDEFAEDCPHHHSFSQRTVSVSGFLENAPIPGRFRARMGEGSRG